MINKKMFKIAIFLFLNLFAFNAFSSEQFKFDIKEIEILENGNKIIGKNRGKISTDNGIIFEADQFTYIKNLNLLNAIGKIKVEDKVNKYLIYTDELNYKKNKNIIISKNNSRAISQDNKIEITAKNFEYDRSKNIITAEENVFVNDKVGKNKIYSDYISYNLNEDIIISKNNSRAISQDNKIEITAKNFEYDRSKNIITAEENVFVNDKVGKNKIYSDYISYNLNEDIIATEGKTSGLIQSKYNFDTTDLILDNKRKELMSKKQTNIQDKNNLYKLKNFKYSINSKVIAGNNALIITNYNLPKSDKLYFSSVIINLEKFNFIGKDTEISLHKDIFDNTKNDPRLKGVSSVKSGELTVINKGIFTTCNKDKNCPPWAIKAEKITHDKKNKKLIYDNATLKIFDVPVLYFPKFFHPDPSVKRQSGLLTPKMSNSNILGNTINIPYFHVISENKDLTFSPTISDKETTFLQTEYRQENKNSNFIADIGFVNNFKSKYSIEKKNIMHLFMKSEVDLNLNDFSSSVLDIYFEKTNKDTYLKIFDSYLLNNKIKPNNENILSSGIDLKLNNENFNLETGFSAFEDLNKKQNDRYQYILPYYKFNSSINNDFGSIYFYSKGNNILQDTNNLRTRIINDLNFSSQDFLYSDTGFKSNFNIYFKNVNTVAKKDKVYKSSAQSEIMNIVETNTSYPLIKSSKSTKEKLTPKLSFRINPSDMKNNSNIERTINVNNIFSIDRLGLEDTIESGKSLTAGIDYVRSNSLKNEEISIKLAKVYRDGKENNIPNNTSLNSTKSYLFGSLDYEKNKIININYNFATEDLIDDFVYHDLGLNLSLNNFVTDFNFIKEDGNFGTSHIIENKSTLNFDNNNFVSFRTRRNEEINLTEYYDLIYEYKYDCLVAGLKFNKTYYQDRELEPSEELFFSITITPLATWEQEVDSGLYE